MAKKSILPWRLSSDSSSFNTDSAAGSSPPIKRRRIQGHSSVPTKDAQNLVDSAISEGPDLGSDAVQADAAVIEQLMEAVESDERLECLMGVIEEGTATTVEMTEWEEYKRALIHANSSRNNKINHVPALAATSEAPLQSSGSHRVSSSFSPPPFAQAETSRRSFLLQVPTPEEDVVCPPKRLKTPVLETSDTSKVVSISESPLFATPRPVTVIDPFGQAKRLRMETEAECKTQATAIKEISQPLQEELQRKNLIIENLKLDLELAKNAHQQQLEEKDAKMEQATTLLQDARSIGNRDLKRLQIELNDAQRRYKEVQLTVDQLKAELGALPAAAIKGEENACKDLDTSSAIELSNLRAEVAALRSSSKVAKDKARPGLSFVHHNLFAAPLVRAPELPKRGRGRPSKPLSTVAHASGDEDSSEHENEQGDNPIPKRGRGRPPRPLSTSVHPSSDGSRGSEYRKGDNATEYTASTESESTQTKFDMMLGLPRTAVAILIDGKLAYRDGTRDVKGRLPRAKAVYKVGRNALRDMR